MRVPQELIDKLVNLVREKSQQSETKNMTCEVKHDNSDFLGNMSFFEVKCDHFSAKFLREYEALLPAQARDCYFMIGDWTDAKRPFITLCISFFSLNK